jgi:hypothetical protein
MQRNKQEKQKSDKKTSNCTKQQRKKNEKAPTKKVG